MQPHLTGLIAATFTPMHDDGSLNLAVVPQYAALLRSRGVSAVFVCGTTGEGTSLSVAEREQVAEAWLRTGALPVIVHTGHTSLTDARRLTQHAAAAGAIATSAMAPFFFKPQTATEVAAWCAAVASAASQLPFYYYHIPSMTGVSIRIEELLRHVKDRIPNFAGVKFTYEDLEDFQASLRYDNGKFDLLFGRDELLLEGTQHGSRGAVGSTYNYASPLYLELLRALENGNTEQARKLQDDAIEMIQVCSSVGAPHLCAAKSLMQGLGVDCGPVRLPLMKLRPEQQQELLAKLEGTNAFRFIYSQQS